MHGGALGRKSTTLLLVRLPAICHMLLRKGLWGRCVHATATHGPLIGKQEDGAFQTSKAKIYPIGLNTIISLEMFRFALHFVDSGTETELPEVFLPTMPMASLTAPLSSQIIMV